MSTRSSWIFFATLLILFSLTGGMPVRADATVPNPPEPVDPQYFWETGHSLSGRFFQKYYSIDNPTRVYGYPITEQFYDPVQGKFVQYFERALFVEQYDDENGFTIQVMDLGRIMYDQDKYQDLPINRRLSNCKSFDVSPDLVICYAFREFFEANNGVESFGYPVSNIVLVDDRIVQYFQFARFEWYPHNPRGTRVQLTDLGSRYFEFSKENPQHLLSIDPFLIRPQSNLDLVLDLKVSAFPQLPVISADGRQTIEIVVQDQKMAPVSGADVRLIIKYPSGQVEQRIATQPTDRFGITRYAIEHQNQPPGLTRVEIIVNLHGKTVSARTSFLIW